MTAVISLASLCLGVTLALYKPQQPDHAARFETVAGIVLIAGLAMIGFGLRNLY